MKDSPKVGGGGRGGQAEETGTQKEKDLWKMISQKSRQASLWGVASPAHRSYFWDNLWTSVVKVGIMLTWRLQEREQCSLKISVCEKTF